MKSIYLIFVNVLAMGTKLSLGIVLECDFVYHQSYWGPKYACIAKNLETTVENRNITTVKGIHQGGKTNDDVRKFLVVHGKCPVLPLNVGQFFKNLEVFYVMKSRVNTLTNEDLKGLDKLNIFDVSHNPIERIENGYFEGKSSIIVISFYNCTLKFVDSSALDPLINLEQGHFQYNHCVDYRGDHKFLLHILKQHLKNCDGTRINIDLYPTAPLDSDYTEEGMEYEEELEVKEVTHSLDISSSTTTTESGIRNEVHYIYEGQMTFVGRNAFVVILLLLLIIIVLIISFGFVQCRAKNNYQRTENHLLREDF